MGQKVHPRAIRLGFIKDWDASWFASGDYPKFVLEDFNIRLYLKSALKRAGVGRIKINRKAGTIVAQVHVARPGVLMGKTGQDASILSEDLTKQFGQVVRVEILEIKHPDLNAKLLSEWIVFQLEKRVPFRRAMKMAVQRALKAGALGVRVACAGRLGGVEIARTEWYKEGKVPLQTFRADIDFAFSEALTTYGKIGVKFWLYHGDIYATKKEQNEKEEATEVMAY